MMKGVEGRETWRTLRSVSLLVWTTSKEVCDVEREERVKGTRSGRHLSAKMMIILNVYTPMGLGFVLFYQFSPAFSREDSITLCRHECLLIKVVIAKLVLMSSPFIKHLQCGHYSI